MRLGAFGNVHRADFHHYATRGVIVEAIGRRSAALQLRRFRRHVVSIAKVIVHAVHSALRGLKKADVKQLRDTPALESCACRTSVSAESPRHSAAQIVY
jgi:hypothetical protein